MTRHRWPPRETPGHPRPLVLGFSWRSLIPAPLADPRSAPHVPRPVAAPNGVTAHPRERHGSYGNGSASLLRWTRISPSPVPRQLSPAARRDPVEPAPEVPREAEMNGGGRNERRREKWTGEGKMNGGGRKRREWVEGQILAPAAEILPRNQWDPRPWGAAERSAAASRRYEEWKSRSRAVAADIAAAAVVEEKQQEEGGGGPSQQETSPPLFTIQSFQGPPWCTSVRGTREGARGRATGSELHSTPSPRGRALGAGRPVHRRAPPLANVGDATRPARQTASRPSLLRPLWLQHGLFEPKSPPKNVDLTSIKPAAVCHPWAAPEPKRARRAGGGDGQTRQSGRSFCQPTSPRGVRPRKGRPDKTNS